MAMHAKSGGNLEIMGMLQGRIQDNSFIVLDAYALPVEGTETRVNAQQEAYEFIVDFAETSQVRTASQEACCCILPFTRPHKLCINLGC